MTSLPTDIFRMLSRTTRPEVPERHLRRAVVLGGSIAGLLAARVLADHADEVVVVDRPGAGVPQRHQVHALLPGGRAQIERWFPGFTAEALAAGATLSMPAGIEAWVDEERAVSTPNAILLNATRPFLEAHLRRRALALPNVTATTGAATGLDYEDGQVSAVRLGTDRLTADFVVDAMGRSSRLADWLARDGWEAPELERMRIDIHYATAYLRRSDPHPALTAAISRCSPTYPRQHISALNAVEDNRWTVLLAAYGDDRPSSDPGDFRARCAHLPAVFGQIAEREPIDHIETYHQGDARRRHYERVTRLPARLVSLGDAVASFNPIYGQGMSSAALQASCLSEYLCGRPDLTEPATAFFRLQAVVVDAAWTLSTSGDAQRIETTRPAFPVRLQRALISQVLRAARSDVVVGTAFNDVTFMNTHPATLATPSLLARAVLTNLRHRRAPEPAVPDPVPARTA
ncbi:FAD-dependent oxidoreductase [Actinoplanes sp. RD1]|uniref:FAD-dependent oxidoreductase n=1 Tax=Actinoplanes sp. RD1 TaxID=3064538 RepID=UPI00274205F3|nr:FAD-dependent monooxygenase [Actinoplanes sp. RD1]